MPGTGSLGVNITTGISGRITNTNVAGSVGEDINATTLLQLLGGTGGGQMDTAYVAQRTVAASAVDTLALNGVLLDAFGNTVNLLHAKAILIVAAAANPGDLTFAPGGTNPANLGFAGTTPSWAISPGEAFLSTKGSASAVGWAIVASTGMNIKLTAAAAAGNYVYTIYVLGTSV